MIGALLAGPWAARSWRGRGYDGRLVLIGDEAHRPYGRPRPPCFWSDPYGIRIRFAGHAAGADSATVEDGGPEAVASSARTAGPDTPSPCPG
ncbi:hypothetical protein [Streptomyces sp. NPDC046859]|uniref:hypothetical protein n=1 Tax=Streptomyces sp. NPDC046859 TaxID=3155734 RepID=UPI0033F1D0FC